MQSFDWLNPTKLIFGKDTINRIGEEIKTQNVSKVLLIAGCGSIKTNGTYETVINSLGRIGIEWFELWSVKPNPVLSKVNEAIEIIRKNDIQAVLAVGGGSVIDTAKAAAAGSFMENVWDIFESKLSVQVRKALPIFIVLTISASGSEMSPFAVITNEEKRQKWDIMGSALYPKISIIDPSVQGKLPWYQTFNGAIDAMSHIMEYYFSADASSETTLSVSEALLRTIIKVTDRLYTDPTEYESRASLAWATTLALNGTSAAGMGNGDWASHRIAMGLSAIDPSIAHGAGLAVIFPAWITYCSDAAPELFKRWAKMVWNCESVDGAVDALKTKINHWRGPASFRELGVSHAQLEIIAHTISDFGVIGSVKKLNEQDVKKILELVF